MPMLEILALRTTSAVSSVGCPNTPERVAATELPSVPRASTATPPPLARSPEPIPNASNAATRAFPAATATRARRALRAEPASEDAAVRAVSSTKPAALTTTARRTWCAASMVRARTAEEMACDAARARRAQRRVLPASMNPVRVNRHVSNAVQKTSHAARVRCATMGTDADFTERTG